MGLLSYRNFPDLDLMLKEPDRVSVLLQVFSMKYDSTLLHGSPYCGKKNMLRKIAGWQRERGRKGDSKGKSKSDGKAKDGGQRVKTIRRASIKEDEKAKIKEKKRRRSSRGGDRWKQCKHRRALRKH